MVVDEDLPPDDVRGTAEGVHPVVVGDDNNRVCVALEVVRFSDEASEMRPDPQRREVRAGYDLGQHRPEFPSRRQVDRRRMPAEDALEELCLLLQIAAHGVGHQVAAAPPVGERVASPIDQHDALRIPDRKQAQQDLIDEREDSSIGADAEGQRQDRRQRKGGCPHEGARRVPEVASAVFDPAPHHDLLHSPGHPKTVIV
jgi:hypothetical protein